MSNKDKAELMSEGKQTIIKFIKNRVFDLIGIAILVAMFALMLNILEGRPLTLQTVFDVLTQLVPFYICAMMLSLNYYKKGSYNGKDTTKFQNVVEAYSDITNDLTGNEIRYLRDFCKEYNEEELKNIQIAILSSEGITYDIFEKYRRYGYWKTRKLTDAATAKVIRRAKAATVVGIDSNILLGNRKSMDGTDLGPSEGKLMAGRGVGYAIGYMFSIGFLVFLTVKKIYDWNWFRLLYEFAKVIYIFVRSYMRYFEGYEDITISLANTINRKTDILKSYKAWFKDRHPDKVDSEQKDTQNTSTEVENQ